MGNIDFAGFSKKRDHWSTKRTQARWTMSDILKTLLRQRVTRALRVENGFRRQTIGAKPICCRQYNGFRLPKWELQSTMPSRIFHHALIASRRLTRFPPRPRRNGCATIHASIQALYSAPLTFYVLLLRVRDLRANAGSLHFQHPADCLTSPRVLRVCPDYAGSMCGRRRGARPHASPAERTGHGPQD